MYYDSMIVWYWFGKFLQDHSVLIELPLKKSYYISYNHRPMGVEFASFPQRALHKSIHPFLMICLILYWRYRWGIYDTNLGTPKVVHEKCFMLVLFSRKPVMVWKGVWGASTLSWRHQASANSDLIVLWAKNLSDKNSVQTLSKTVKTSMQWSNVDHARKCCRYLGEYCLQNT